LMRLFTVFNIPFFNPNTAEEEVLSIAYPADKVQEILSARNSKGYYAETLSSHFRVQATGKMNHSETRHTIVAVLEKVGTDETAQLLVRYWKDNEFGL
ncbi:MAG: hypothetical protein ACE5ER_13150, partial [Nitrospinaceae bacterium]